MKTILAFLFLISMLCFVSMESIAQDYDCNCGSFLVKFEYDSDTETFVPEGGDAKGITLTIYYNDEDPREAIRVDWTSSQYWICEIAVKAGSNDHVAETYDPSAASGTTNTYGKPSISHIDFCGDGLNPVELNSFAAQTNGTIITLKWATATETENLGFHVYRNTSEKGDYVQITKEMILGAGSSGEAHSYSYIDREVKTGNTYYYKLADVDFNGNINFHGPISVTIESLPANYSLAQCYPNPFNPETAINFSLEKAGKVSLKIYNLQGQLVRTLVDEEKPAGSYSVMWNGTTYQGLKVSSGTYIYTLKVNGFENTKKMTFTQ